jgi:hypothetical protein
MSQQWIIEVIDDDGRPCFICEHEGELYLTRHRSDAAVYPTELDAKCALVYIADKHQPRLTPAHKSAAG